jgi:hypothetical protein
MLKQYMFSIILGKSQPFDFHPFYFNTFRISLEDEQDFDKE